MAIERLVDKFLNDKLHITVDDCDRLLDSYGYVLRKGGGSHRTYHKTRARPITVVAPKGKKYVTTVYVNKVIRDLKLEG
jgi:predicted RNA binding protein YcfA (HicA-like mRNA interferase family)